MTGKRRASTSRKKDPGVNQHVQELYAEACIVLESIPALLGLQPLTDTIIIQVLIK